MMYLHAGRDTVVRTADIVAVFDADYATSNRDTVEFLRKAEKSGKMINVTDELPKAFILTKDGTVYMTQLSAQTLTGRM